MKNFLVLMGLIFCFATLYFYTVWQPAEERKFLGVITVKLNAGEAKFSLKKVTSFEWDKVCGISINASLPPGLSEEDIEAFLGLKLADFKGDIPKILYDSNAILIPRPVTRLVLFFIKENKVIKILKFKNPYAKKESEHILVQMKNEQRSCFNKNYASVFFKKGDQYNYLEIGEQ